jgi:uncharacterized protein (DUF849 family)
MKSEHEGVPVTAEEIAADAKRVVDAGAGAVHIHPRSSEGTETLDPDLCGEAVTLLREICPKVPLGLSTAKWIEANPAKRLDAVRRWEALPDFASVNFNETGHVALCKLLRDRGVGVEAGIWSVEDAARLNKSSLGGSCLRILVEITENDPQKAVSLANRIERYLGRAGVVAPRLHHGYGRVAWSVMKNAILAGKDIRVGLEDTLVLADGRRTEDNEQLIRAAVRLAESFGREPLKTAM